MWEEAVLNQFEALWGGGVFLEGGRKTTKSRMIAGDWAKIQTWYLKSRKQSCQPHRTATVDVLMHYLLIIGHYMTGVASQTSLGCQAAQLGKQTYVNKNVFPFMFFLFLFNCSRINSTKSPASGAGSVS